MDRRDFIKTTGTVIAATAVAQGLSATAQTAPASKGRVVLPINRRWRFSPKATEAAHERAFDDSGFARVTVPHTNIRLPWHSFDEKTYEFISIYRRHFRLPPGARGRRVFVDFEGVMTASTVWLNGIRLGEYKGGYTPFSFELTPHIDWPAKTSSPSKSTPPSAPTFRPSATKSTTSPSAASTAKFHSGWFPPPSLKTSSPSQRMSSPATLRSMSIASSSTAKTRTLPTTRCTLEAALYDGDRLIAKATQELPVDGRRNRTHTVHLEDLGKIELWGLKSPKLYRVEVRMLRGSRVLDSDYAPHRLPRSQIHPAGLLAQRHSRQAARPRPPSDLSLGGSGDARPRTAPRCHHSAQEPATATSSVPRTIRSHAISSMPATRSGCWCSKRFQAGSTSATKPGRISPSTMSTA